MDGGDVRDGAQPEGDDVGHGDDQRREPGGLHEPPEALLHRQAGVPVVELVQACTIAILAPRLQKFSMGSTSPASLQQGCKDVLHVFKPQYTLCFHSTYLPYDLILSNGSPPPADRHWPGIALQRISHGVVCCAA